MKLLQLIKNFFRKPAAKTGIHPDYKKLIRPIMEIDGRTLYEFEDIGDMPHMRYTQFDKFNTEISMRVDAEILKDSLDAATKALDKGKISEAVGILTTLKYQTDLLISLEGYYRLVSCAYFWIDEDLTEYDYAINDEKIALFKKHKLDDFFFKEPVKKFLPLMNISLQGLEIYLSQERQFRSLLLDQLKKSGLEKYNPIS